ncbi:hypothetical protein E3N88_28996 [Mikania micrantha]|uniref:Uncharacterized protein n=1 Tax=Mikania micrantha TaxID=192012 RepID=A0A5N6N3W5_9ASTR|nr:hypothetical protein E3N88_28996 [Mikania micrantha]
MCIRSDPINSPPIFNFEYHNFVYAVSSFRLQNICSEAISISRPDFKLLLRPSYRSSLGDPRYRILSNFDHAFESYAYLEDPPQKHAEFKSMVDGLILSPVNYAIMEHPTIFSDYIESFWSTITEHTNSNGDISIVGKIQGKSITIT